MICDLFYLPFGSYRRNYGKNTLFSSLGCGLWVQPSTDPINLVQGKRIKSVFLACLKCWREGNSLKIKSLRFIHIKIMYMLNKVLPNIWGLFQDFKLLLWEKSSKYFRCLNYCNSTCQYFLKYYVNWWDVFI